jgi:putative pyruvate formate lyase activating enzyme
MNISTKLLNRCNVCPRNCNVNRYETNKGYCRIDAGFYIASIFPHKGEEPPISGDKGICNVFFAHCNLQCVYCQNYQISRNKIAPDKYKMTLEQVVQKITDILDTGIQTLGFVSPSHFVPQIIQIIDRLHQLKYFPTIVYNTNAYDNVDSLKILESYVDVYLPDFKYIENDISQKYSLAKNYPEIAIAAIKEMYRQKGDYLIINKNGYAESGMIIRHLILPNNVENSLKILDFIANEISTNIAISLMSQYYPTAEAFKFPELSRPINSAEYQKVVQRAKKLGLTNGWIQQMDSKSNYKPDFEKEIPFK